MAIKRQNSNPIVYIDGVVVAADPDNKPIYVDGPDGKRVPKVDTGGKRLTEYVGRVLAVQTGMPNSDLLEVRVPQDFDGVTFGVGEQRLMVCEYSEWEYQGRSGSKLKWLADVSSAQAKQWSDYLKTAESA